MAPRPVGLTHEAEAKRSATRALLKSPDEMIAGVTFPGGEEQKAAVLKRLTDMPETYRGIYLKAMEGNSLASAAKAFCLECMGWARSEIPLCTAPACPLYPYRPYTGRTEQP